MPHLRPFNAASPPVHPISSPRLIAKEFVAASHLKSVEAKAPPFAILLFELFLSTALAGVGILLGVAMGYVTRGFTRLLVAYLRFNVQMVKGGMKA